MKNGQDKVHKGQEAKAKGFFQGYFTEMVQKDGKTLEEDLLWRDPLSLLYPFSAAMGT